MNQIPLTEGLLFIAISAVITGMAYVLGRYDGRRNGNGKD